MRIGLNLLHALPEIGGGWNYIANLVAALGKWDNTNTYVAFVTDASKCLVPVKPNFICVPIDIRSVSRVQRIAYENTRLQWLARRHQLDCMHWFANTQAVFNTVPGVVTVYDLHAFLKYASYSWVKRVYLKNMIFFATRKASMLLPMSQATALDLQHKLGVSANRMTVIPPTLETNLRPSSDSEITYLKSKYNLPNKFWLYVAHFYPHKNHLRLLQAYSEMKLKGLTPWKLVLRGDPAGIEDEVIRLIEEFQLNEDVFMLPRINDGEMPILYSAATALIFPSLYEGGGMPILEARFCGCPLVVADIPAAHEFAGSNANFFDPSDVSSIMKAMSNFQKTYREELKKKTFTLQKKNENWNKEIIDKLTGVYAKVAACGRTGQKGVNKF